MLAFNAALMASIFGLYYLASEILRPWASGLHIAFGSVMPLLFLAHVKTGRKLAERLLSSDHVVEIPIGICR
ncbi:MAG: hypothetical protein ACR2KT_12285 [Methylocella sp.]